MARSDLAGDRIHMENVYWAAATSVLSPSIFMAALRCGASHGWVVASHPHVSNVIAGRNARRTLLGLQIPINLHLSLDTTLRSRKEDSCITVRQV